MILKVCDKLCIYKLLSPLILKLHSLQLYKLKLNYGNHIIGHLSVGDSFVVNDKLHVDFVNM
jgi:hypothetical protein